VRSACWITSCETLHHDRVRVEPAGLGEDRPRGRRGLRDRHRRRVEPRLPGELRPLGGRLLGALDARGVDLAGVGNGRHHPEPDSRAGDDLRERLPHRQHRDRLAGEQLAGALHSRAGVR
jgi:hypothetical protein